MKASTLTLTVLGLFAMVSPIAVWARPYKVPHVLVVVSGDNAPDSERCYDVWNELVPRLASSNIEATLKQVVFVPDFFPELRTFGSYTDRLFKWGDWARQAGLRSPRWITHILLPPGLVGTDYFIGGVARMTCGFRTTYSYSYSYSSWEEENSREEERFRHSITVAEHEIRHLLGAAHRDSPGGCNIMAPDALPCVNTMYPLPILPETHKDILKCMKKRFPRRTAREYHAAQNAKGR